MAWHTTGSREELLIVVRGGVVVETRLPAHGSLPTQAGADRRLRRQVLRGGQTLFLPPRVEHQVVNATRRAARYIYVTG